MGAKITTFTKFSTDINADGKLIKNYPTPVDDTDVSNKAYVDSVAPIAKPHLLGGDVHTADSLADLNTKIDDADLPAAADIIASRPTAGTAGRFFWATDEGILYRDKGTASTTWAASTAYLVGDFVKPTELKLTGYLYECTTAGTSGTDEPIWPTVPGDTIPDGTVVWTCRAEWDEMTYTKPDGSTLITGNWDWADYVINNLGFLTLGVNTSGHGLGVKGDLLISGKLEVDGRTYFDGLVDFYNIVTLGTNVFLSLGTGGLSKLEYDALQATDTLVWGLGAIPKSIIFTDFANINKEHGHGAQTHPTLFGHSVTDPTVDSTEWWSLTHDGINGILNVGKGNWSLNSKKLINQLDPTDLQDGATKGYVDSIVQGLDWQESVLDKDLSTPPGTPASGDRYIIALAGKNAIVAVDTVLKKFSILDDQTLLYAVDDIIRIDNSTGNDGWYTITAVSFVSPNTEITVAETVPDATADGDTEYAAGAWSTVGVDKITEWDGAAWLSITPNKGFACLVEDEGLQYTWNETIWAEFGSTVNHQALTNLQGGQANEYYHLTTAERGWVQGNGDLSNVTNDAQLKRVAGDINSFTEKLAPVDADVLLIEDSADTYNKKKVQISNLPTGVGDGATEPISLTPKGATTPTIGGAEANKNDGTNHTWMELLFSDAVDEKAEWEFDVPSYYAGVNLNVNIKWYANDATGLGVLFSIQTLSAADATLFDSALATAVTATGTTSATAGDENKINTTTIPLTAPFTAGHIAKLVLKRVGTDTATDTLTMDAKVIMVSIERA